MDDCSLRGNPWSDIDYPQAHTPTKGPGATHTCGKSLGQHNNHSTRHERLYRAHLKKVNVRRFAAIAIAGGAATVVLILVASGYWEHKQRLFTNPTDLFAAVRAFSSDQARRGRVPPEVSLQELLKGGYVSSNEVRAFQGFEVTFSTHYSEDTPQMILARALAPDGQAICLLADGSVQQLSPARYREYLKSRGQPNGTPSRNEKPRPDETSATNGLPREH